MVWSRGMISSLWLHSKKFSGPSEGILDILISDQIGGVGGGGGGGGVWGEGK